MHETDAFGIEIMGDKGGARVYVKDYAKVGDVGLFSDLNGAMTDTKPRLYEQHSHGRMVSNFVDAILNGTPMSPNGAEGLNRVRLLEAIYDSAELGREISFGS